MNKLRYTPSSTHIGAQQIHAATDLPKHNITAGTPGGIIYPGAHVDDNSWVDEGVIIGGPSTITNSRISGHNTVIQESAISNSSINHCDLFRSIITNSELVDVQDAGSPISSSTLHHAETLGTIITDTTITGAELCRVPVRNAPPVTGGRILGEHQVVVVETPSGVVCAYHGGDGVVYVSHPTLGTLTTSELGRLIHEKESAAHGISREETLVLVKLIAAAPLISHE